MNDVLIPKSEAAGVAYVAAEICNKRILTARNEHIKETLRLVVELLKHVGEEIEKIEPPKKEPLEFGMIFAGAVCIEFKGKLELETVAFVLDDQTYAGMVRYIQFGTSNRNYVDVDLYGLFWRCWAGCPTQEERKAAEWRNR